MNKEKQSIKKSKLTPMMKQYYEIKNDYEDYILFYRLGDFYEMFFDDAIIAARELEITLTGRNCGLEEKAPLCGVPFHSADGYIRKLVEKGFKVAICEQVEDPKQTKGIVKREVVRVITPGTIIDPEMLNDQNNNYLMSLSYDEEHGFGIAFCDITTGELKTTSSRNLQLCFDEILRISPREILLSQGQKEDKVIEDLILHLEKQAVVITYFEEAYFQSSNAEEVIKRILKVFAVESLGLMDKVVQMTALGSLLAYIEENAKVPLVHITEVHLYETGKYMVLDKFTRRNLELTETMRSKEKRGSLLWVLDKTSTAMGARKLKQWIEEPLLNIDEINTRNHTVEILVEDLLLRSDIKDLLKKVYDLERLSTKLVYKNANPRDLVALKQSLSILPDLRALLQDRNEGAFPTINRRIDPLEDIVKLIDLSIIDEPPIVIKEGGVIQTGYSEALDELRDIEKNGQQWILNVEMRERERTGIKNLKIGYNKVFGYYIEVTKANSKLAPEDYIRKQTLANSERYITPELKTIEEKVLGAKEKISRLENELFTQIKETLLLEVKRILKTASAVASLDALLSFAEISYRYGYVKPIVTKQGAINIENGRHPVIERIFNQEPFIPNDTILNQESDHFYIITGPNMAGKSTYLRQVALITLLAQVGCFVPASKAEIGIVDRIFTRVGASDDLSQGQSTFMVEMNELANILNNATKDSLVILDEIGRGTSTYDGLSIAWSVVEYLSEISGIKAKTLFATHYHELTELEGKVHGVKNYRIAVKEKKDDIVFLRKIERGGANQSYGIQVAKLAGVPSPVIERSKAILKKLELHDINNNIANINREVNDVNRVAESKLDLLPLEKHCLDLSHSVKNSDNHEITMKYERANDFLKQIENIQINDLTPMDAMNELYKLVTEARKLK